jgi:hypothetical protein
MARLIDDQLQDLTAQHEQEIKALERNMDVYKKQYVKCFFFLCLYTYPHRLPGADEVSGYLVMILVIAICDGLTFCEQLS